MARGGNIACARQNRQYFSQPDDENRVTRADLRRASDLAAGSARDNRPFRAKIRRRLPRPLGPTGRIDFLFAHGPVAQLDRARPS